jgi:glucan biosynthesis protein
MLKKSDTYYISTKESYATTRFLTRFRRLHCSGSAASQAVRRRTRCHHHAQPSRSATDLRLRLAQGAARALATGVYQPPVSHIPEAVQALDWDQYQAINYRADHALWAHDCRRFQVKFFHLGLYYTSPVRIHEVVHGQAQELAYDPAMFDYGKSGLENTHLSKGLGFAGFRAHFHTDLDRDLVAFPRRELFSCGRWRDAVRSVSPRAGHRLRDGPR